MTVIYQNYFATAFNAVGLNVVHEDGWETRSQPTSNSFIPQGVMVHHTAPPVPYPVSNLMDKVQLNIKPDGTVHVIAAGYQYHAGSGSKVVLAETLANQAPSERASVRGLADDSNGNPHYVGIEVDHAGDGGPLPAAQAVALYITAAVICYEHGWPVERVISHSEWTARKPDPYWDGLRWPTPQIRNAVEPILAEFNSRVFLDIPDTHFYHAEIAAAAAAGVFRGYDDGTFRPSQSISRAQLAAVLWRLGLT